MNKNNKTVFVLCLIPILAAALTVGGRYTWDRFLGEIPRLDCPRSLDLGERVRGETVIGHFQIQNIGRGMLIVNDFSTSCSCAGVEQEVDGRVARVKSIHLSPDEKVNLLVRVGIVGRLGQSQLVHISFTTNDPDNPIGQTDVIIPRVLGGFVSEPSAVVFGTFPLGEKPTQTIDLYENGNPDCTVKEVRISHPDRFRAILLPLSDEDKRVVHQTAGKLFARIKVTAHSESPGRFDGEIRVFLKDEHRSTEPIPVLGEGVSLAESRPAILVLPRQVGNQTVRSGEVLIFNRQEKPIDVVVDTQSPDVIAKVCAVPGRLDRHLLIVEWHPQTHRKEEQVSEARIRLRVRSESEETRLEVPILLEDRSL